MDFWQRREDPKNIIEKLVHKRLDGVKMNLIINKKTKTISL
jgi:hypothetical protein